MYDLEKPVGHLSLDQLRQKLTENGASFLPDSELLVLVLGCRAGRLLEAAENFSGHKNLPVADQLWQLASGGGHSAVLACRLLAAYEFCRRRLRPGEQRVLLPADTLPLLRHYSEKKQENFIAISLNGANEVIAVRLITVGLVNSTQVHPREVFAEPITDRATAIIVAHNHPSQRLEPSPEDIQITRRLAQAGQILGIQLLDHIIFSGKNYYSFAENEIMP